MNYSYSITKRGDEWFCYFYEHDIIDNDIFKLVEYITDISHTDLMTKISKYVDEINKNL